MDFIIEDERIYKEDSDGKLLAEVLFPDNEDGTVTITHTFVDASLRGQGIADKLLKTVVSELSRNNKKAIPLCPYADKWFEKHPKHSNLLANI